LRPPVVVRARAAAWYASVCLLKTSCPATKGVPAAMIFSTSLRQLRRYRHSQPADPMSPPPTSRFLVAPLLFALSLAVITVTGLLSGCGQQAPGPMEMSDEELENWEIALVEMRIEKNEAFMDTATTPLPAGKLAGFEGLNYYYPEPSLRFHVPFTPAASPDTVMLQKRKGNQVPYLERGTVSFRHEGQTYRLAVFGPADTTATEELWLPFYDETNDEQTYAGGRYLDLKVDEDGMVDLDFNYAYNPLCDYNPEHYNCTLPPPDNTLLFPVEAGEKRFALAE
jgi:uncharacterized protein (DUF1684 family)